MKIIEELVDSLSILQGVGQKTANRYAYEILQLDKEKREQLIKNIENLNNIKKCNICNNYTLDEICQYCLEEDRISNTLVLVAYSKDINKIEKILPNKYKYYVLDGVIDPLNGIKVEDLQIPKLLNLIEKRNIDEIIIVLPTNNEGEITSAYLKKLLENKNINFTKLAQGVPIGGDLEYLDELTLLKSIENRQNF